MKKKEKSVIACLPYMYKPDKIYPSVNMPFLTSSFREFFDLSTISFLSSLLFASFCVENKEHRRLGHTSYIRQPVVCMLVNRDSIFQHLHLTRSPARLMRSSCWIFTSFDVQVPYQL